MSDITKAQWQDIERELTDWLPDVEFALDGFIINVSRQRISEQKAALVVYINGELKGDWMVNKDNRPSIIPQVWKTKTRSLYSPSKVKKLEKEIGKRRAKQYIPNLHGKSSHLVPYFSSAAVLVRQFKKIEGLVLTRAICSTKAAASNEDSACLTATN
ncbi:Putative uncharacterized protein [Moritella viscosa]|uniref:hypothetical protein n=1 Tax=Moritella viscosa TaxID=80854 RepID=UPI000923C049|nr:hypothetical protein [Moritella viscosa]SHO20125.1 Putative uncharacterized protein [Moritella viscosa]